MNAQIITDLLRLVGVALLVFANGFFVAAEFALVSVRRTRIEELVRQGKARAASGHEMVHSVEELRMLVAASGESGVLERSERDMLDAVFDFGDETAREVMVPRTEMVAVPADAPLDHLIQCAIKHPLTKFPVYEGDLDHILGIAHTKDLVRVQHGERRTATVRGLIREAFFVPDTIKLGDLLQQFRAKREHMAIVLDEYGGTAGLVTLDDLMEQIVGEVSDAFDRQAPAIQRLP